MKLAIMTLCYNEEETLGAVLRNWSNVLCHQLVLHSEKPWHGEELPPDRSEEICREYGREFIRLPWTSETEQRNWGLAYLYKYDYVLIVDADELYTGEDKNKILDMLGKSNEEHYDNLDCYRAQRVKTYFKSPDYVLDPPDTHKPVIAINPKRRLFAEHRVPSTDYQIPIDVTMHHLSYLRSDGRMYHKLRQFEHHDIVKKFWYENIWKKFVPGSAMPAGGLRAYGAEYSNAIRDPMPQALRDLL